MANDDGRDDANENSGAETAPANDAAPVAPPIVYGAPTPQRQPYWRMADNDPIVAPLPDDAGFTEAEKWAWSKIIRGKIANMAELDDEDEKTGVDPHEEVTDPDDPTRRSLKPWPDNRTLSARFLKTILLHEPWRSAKADQRVQIMFATIPDTVNLDGAEIADDLWLMVCRLERSISLIEAKFAKSLSLQGSRLAGTLAADRAKIAGSLFLRNGFQAVGEVSLRSATIQGGADMSGSSYLGPLSLDNVTVGRILRMHPVTFDESFGRLSWLFRASDEVSLSGSNIGGGIILQKGIANSHIDLTRARIGGDLEMNDGFRCEGYLFGTNMNVGGRLNFVSSIFENGFDISGAAVRRGAFFSNGRFEREVQLISTHVTDSVAFEGAQIKSGMSADGLRVDGALFLRKGLEVDGPLKLLGARIGSDLQLRDSTFNDRIDLTGAHVGGELQFDQGDKDPPGWGPDARIVLRNATVGALSGSLKSLRHAPKDADLKTRAKAACVKTDLVGFSYERIGGNTGKELTTDAETFAAATPKELINFLRSDAPVRGRFKPQPYRQLADALDVAGEESKADRIREALFDHEQRAKGVGRLRKAELALRSLLIRYGYRNWRAFGWFGLAVFVAVLAARALAPSAIVTPADAAAWGSFALDSAIPLLELDVSHREFLDDRFDGAPPPGMGAIFSTLKLTGFVIISYLVAGVTGLARANARGK